MLGRFPLELLLWVWIAVAVQPVGVPVVAFGDDVSTAA